MGFVRLTKLLSAIRTKRVLDQEQKDPSEFRDKLRQRVALATSPQSVTIDARRLLCPMPVIRVQQAVAKLPAGTHVTAICTDPGALHDIPAWARIHGHSVVATHSISIYTNCRTVFFRPSNCSAV